jgi:cytochrome c oxidase subunit III
MRRARRARRLKRVSIETIAAPAEKFRLFPNRNQFGMLAFLVSLTIFFGALIFAYWWVLHGRSTLQQIVVPPALRWSTIILCASGVTLAWGRWSIRRARLDEYRALIGVTALLGVGFLVSQGLACLDLAAQGLYVVGNPHGSMFYTFTGFHAFHLFGGLAALGFLVWNAGRLRDGEETPMRRNRTQAEMVAYYWNFVIVSWVVLYVLLLSWTNT